MSLRTFVARAVPGTLAGQMKSTECDELCRTATYVPLIRMAGSDSHLPSRVAMAPGTHAGPADPVAEFARSARTGASGPTSMVVVLDVAAPREFVAVKVIV